MKLGSRKLEDLERVHLAEVVRHAVQMRILVQAEHPQRRQPAEPLQRRWHRRVERCNQVEHVRLAGKDALHAGIRTGPP